MANTNFLQFDSQGTNMLSDENYSSDSQRTAGVSEGLARSALYNKQAFQASTMVKAIADFLVDGGQNAMDNNLVALTNALKQVIATKGANNTFTGTNTFTGLVNFNWLVNFSHPEIITHEVMPNYTAGVTISPNTTYTAPSNGFVVIYAAGYLTSTLTINGIQVFSHVWEANYGSPDWCCFPVTAGDVIVFGFAGSGSTSSVFYPSIGG